MVERIGCSRLLKSIGLKRKKHNAEKCVSRLLRVESYASLNRTLDSFNGPRAYLRTKIMVS